MRIVITITAALLFPLSLFAQQYATISPVNNAGVISNAPGQSAGSNVSVQGSINIPALNSVDAIIMNSEQARFTDWADINNGKVVPNYASVTVKSSGPWVLYAKLEHSFSGDDDVVTYSLREKSQGNYIQLSTLPVAVFSSNNNNIINNYQFDLKLATNYKKFRPGNYNVNVVFTITSQ